MTAAIQVRYRLASALAAHRAGELQRAEALYEDTLRLQPDHFDAVHMLGALALQMGDPQRALGLIERALERHPAHGFRHQALNNRGLALQHLGEPERALASYSAAIALKPDYPDAHLNRARVLRQLCRWPEALASYEQAVAVAPGCAAAHLEMAQTLRALKRPEAALRCYGRAIGCDAALAEAFFQRGSLLHELNQFEAALRDYDQALALRADHGVALSNRGVVLKDLGRWQEALTSLDRAAALRPLAYQPQMNRGSVLAALGRVDEAIAAFECAIGCAPGQARPREGKAMALLLAGNFRDGWLEYESRQSDDDGAVKSDYQGPGCPRWSGAEAIEGRTVLLRSEQGLGDTIQFCRYAELLAARGATVILEVQRPLRALLAGVRGAAQVVAHGDRVPPCDFWSPLMSLPLALMRTTEGIPCRVPYLECDERKALLWRQRLGEHSRPRVGLVWSGGFRPQHPELWTLNARRNVPLAALQPLRHAAVDFYSLQKGQPAAEELSELASRGWEGPGLIDFSGELEDFSDTAALIANLDLVISVDTSTLHLAAALGKPVWLLNRFDTCWRWLLDREDSPWYPTLRIYRQSRPGDWAGVVSRVRDDLDALARELCPG